MSGEEIQEALAGVVLVVGSGIVALLAIWWLYS